jgi:hypothetical protein
MPYWRFAKAAVSPPTATIAMRLTTQGLAENAGDRHHNNTRFYMLWFLAQRRSRRKPHKAHYATFALA